jgi:adenine-specific DNA-methyltransferase
MIIFRALAAMFPNAVTEAIDENGEVVRAIDKECADAGNLCQRLLRQGGALQFTWPDKKKSVLLAILPLPNPAPVRDDENFLQEQTAAASLLQQRKCRL